MTVPYLSTILALGQPQQGSQAPGWTGMVPLVLLYELSILLATLFGGPAARTVRGSPVAEGPG